MTQLIPPHLWNTTHAQPTEQSRLEKQIPSEQFRRYIINSWRSQHSSFNSQNGDRECEAAREAEVVPVDVLLRCSTWLWALPAPATSTPGRLADATILKTNGKLGFFIIEHAFQSNSVTPGDWGCLAVLSRDNGSWNVCSNRSVNLPRKYLGSLYSLGKNLCFAAKQDQSSVTHILFFFLIKKNKVTVWKQTQAENNSASGAKSQTQTLSSSCGQAQSKAGPALALGKDELGGIQKCWFPTVLLGRTTVTATGTHFYIILFTLIY